MYSVDAFATQYHSASIHTRVKIWCHALTLVNNTRCRPPCFPEIQHWLWLVVWCQIFSTTYLNRIPAACLRSWGWSHGTSVALHMLSFKTGRVAKHNFSVLSKFVLLAALLNWPLIMHIPLFDWSDSLDNTLWVDPLVQRIHLPSIQTTVNIHNIRQELLDEGFAEDNPEVRYDSISVCPSVSCFLQKYIWRNASKSGKISFKIFFFPVFFSV